MDKAEASRLRRQLEEIRAELKRLQEKYEPKQEPIFDFDRHYRKVSNFEGRLWSR